MKNEKKQEKRDKRRRRRSEDTVRVTHEYRSLIRCMKGNPLSSILPSFSRRILISRHGTDVTEVAFPARQAWSPFLRLIHDEGSRINGSAASSGIYGITIPEPNQPDCLQPCRPYLDGTLSRSLFLLLLLLILRTMNPHERAPLTSPTVRIASRKNTFSSTGYDLWCARVRESLANYMELALLALEMQSKEDESLFMQRWKLCQI